MIFSFIHYHQEDPTRSIKLITGALTIQDKGQGSEVSSHTLPLNTHSHTYTTKDIQRHKIVQSFTTDVNEEAFSVFLNFVPNRKRVENSRSIKGEEFLIQSVWWSYCCLQDERPSVSLFDSRGTSVFEFFCVCVSLLFWTLQESVVWSWMPWVKCDCASRDQSISESHCWCQEQTSNERQREMGRERRKRETEIERQTGLRGALRVEQDVGLSAAHLLHTAHVHLRVVTVNPETCKTNAITIARMWKQGLHSYQLWTLDSLVKNCDSPPSVL